ncbi:MAG TPA: serine/threonine-protein kinase, partial [Candidatus Eisenbacteria bacterium]|nr:serine/threonine-protein kinase [Candidatus Eisenbacteria bacterium]
MLGRTLGRFTITAPLGEGGIATVWKATDGLLGRTVAVKVLRPEYAHDRKARLRFLREAQNHASLDHPGVVAVLDYGECGDMVYLALALIEGRTVTARVKEGLLPIAEAVRVAAAASDALAAAHGRVPPLVHRDITGNNVMIADDGRVLVLDFGLAVVAGRTRFTSTGRVIGTPAYVAPELIEGAEPTPRSDVFSLGVLAYELLASDVPFAIEHPDMAAMASMQTPRPLRALRPDASPGLEAVVMRAIARAPLERFADAGALRDALAPWQAAATVVASDAPARAGAPAPNLLAQRTEPVHGAPRFVVVAPFAPPAPAAD